MQKDRYNSVKLYLVFLIGMFLSMTLCGLRVALLRAEEDTFWVRQSILLEILTKVKAQGRDLPDNLKELKNLSIDLDQNKTSTLCGLIESLSQYSELVYNPSAWGQKGHVLISSNTGPDGNFCVTFGDGGKSICRVYWANDGMEHVTLHPNKVDLRAEKKVSSKLRWWSGLYLGLSCAIGILIVYGLVLRRRQLTKK